MFECVLLQCEQNTCWCAWQYEIKGDNFPKKMTASIISANASKMVYVYIQSPRAKKEVV